MPEKSESLPAMLCADGDVDWAGPGAAQAARMKTEASKRTRVN